MTAAAVGLTRLNGFAATNDSHSSNDLRIKRPCKVTVIRRELYSDLQNLYSDDPETGRCEKFESGQTFNIASGQGRPEGFCVKAWNAIAGCVNGLDFCPENEGKGRTLVVACPDGSRPVIFKVELA